MTPMSFTDFAILLVACSATMLACRCIPLFVLKGRELSPAVTDALSLIPPAAFAALVSNDLFTPGAFAADPWGALKPVIAALLVAVVAKKSGSLVICAVTGLVAYAALLYLV
jgi:branched-subunit amino acid transport protein